MRKTNLQNRVAETKKVKRPSRIKKAEITYKPNAGQGSELSSNQLWVFISTALLLISAVLITAFMGGKIQAEEALFVAIALGLIGLITTIVNSGNSLQNKVTDRKITITNGKAVARKVNKKAND